MILKSFLIEKNISQLNEYNVNLVYGENLGLKDDIKNAVKIHFKGYEQISFNQDEIIKNNKLLNEQIYNVSLFSKKKIIFLNEISDKIKDLLIEFIEKPNLDVKIFLFAQNLEKKSLIRKLFEKEKKLGIIACYQDNERTLADYIRKKLEGYNGLTQQIVNFIINNSGLDRKTISNEIDKIKSLFLDKKIKIEKLPELLNNNNNLDFNDVRDSCLEGNREKLNNNLSNVIFQNENSYFYLSVLITRIEKLIKLNDELKIEKSLERAIDKIKPPVFWKDKPIFLKQIRIWNKKKLIDAKKMLFDTEINIKKNGNSNNTILIKNLVINLYQKGTSTS